jgi:hypothetical protein
MTTFLIILVVIVLLVILIATFDKWFGTAVFILVILILIQVGSKDQLPLFTYLVDGIKILKEMRGE